MEHPPRLLLLASADAARLAFALREGDAPPAFVAASADGLARALRQGSWDVVVASATVLPPAEALAAVKTAHPDVPVVVVAGADADPEALADAGATAVLAAADAHLVSAAVTRALTGDAGDATLPGQDAGALQALAEHLPVGLYRSTPDGRILFANEAFADVIGADSVEALDALDLRSDFGYPREHFVEQFGSTGAVHNLVVQWTDRKGRSKFTRENARAVCAVDGSVRYYEGTMEDVTAEYEARERERHRAEQLGAVVRFATAVDEATTADTVYGAAVEAVAAVMGTPYVMLLAHRDDETLCVAWSEAILEDAVALFNDLHVGDLLPLHTQPVLLRDERVSEHVPLPEAVRAMMRAHGIRSIGSFPLVHHGCAHGAFVVLHDAPHTFSDEELRMAETLAWHVAGSLARQRAESGLRDSETCLRFLAEDTAHVLYRLRHGDDGARSVFDYLSPNVEALIGYTPEEVAALGGLGGLVEAREVLQGDGLLEGGDGEHLLACYRLRTKDGGEVWVEDNAYPWHDAADRTVGLIGVLQDVTERKRREEDAAAEAARVLCQQKALVELGGLHAGGPEFVIGRAVELVAECTGVARVGVWIEEAPGGAMPCLGLHTADGAAAHTEPAIPAGAVDALLSELAQSRCLALEDVAASALMAEISAEDYFSDRDVRAVLLAPVRRHGRVTGLVALQHTEGPRPWSAAEQEFAAAVADVVALAYERAERRAAEAARQESEARYRAISDLASDYAFAVHLDEVGGGHLAWATEAFARVTGYAPGDIRRLRDLLAIVHPESRLAALGAWRALEGGEDADLALRIVTKEGEDRWVRHRARRVTGEADGLAVLYHSGQDVTERKRFERELIVAREQAEEVARLKGAFLANMSHEIRTPLTGILGYAGLLAEEVEGEHREFVDFIEKSGRRLLDTLNSVLELARLEANGVEPTLERLDMAAEAHQAACLLAPLAEEKGLALTLETPGTGAALAALDRVCLGRILANLIGNAVKFTDEGGVHVAVAVEGSDVVVRVRDTGCGIAADFLPHLFDEFKQESEGHARSHEGAGLGLAISKRLTDLLGGTIAVESTRPGGTTFTVTFPRYFAPASAGDGVSTDLPTEPVLFVRPAAVDEEAAPLVLDAATEEAPEGETGDPDAGEPDAAEPEVAEMPEEVFAFSESFVPDDDPPVALLVPEDVFDYAAPVVETAAYAEAAEYDLTPEGDALQEAAIAPPTADADDVPFADGFSLGAVPLEAVALDAPEPEQPEPTPTWPDPAAPQLDIPMLDLMPLDTATVGTDPLTDPLTAPLGSVAEAGTDEQEDVLVAVGPSVLVVEDNEDTRALLHRLLQRAYRVVAVSDALAALDRMNREQFDALILDINLGGKQTGIDVLRIARTLPGYADVFAVALTAYALPGDRERFLAAGFDRYVSKPFTRATLMAALTEGVPAA